MGYLMPKSSLLKNSYDTIKPIPGVGIKGFHIFLEGISLKVNVIAQLGFELPHFEVTV